jgi:hypothetical protein
MNPTDSKLSPEPFTEGVDAWFLGWNGRWWRACPPSQVMQLFREVKTQDRTAPSDHQEVAFYEGGVMCRKFAFSTRSFRAREAGGSVVQTFGGGTVFECLGGSAGPGFVRPKPAAAAQPTAPVERLDISRRPPAPIGVPGHRRLRR